MLVFAATLLMFLFPLAFSPGPGNMFFATMSARFGFAATLRANAGYHLATLAVTLLIGLGLISVLEPGSAIFAALKMAGGFYVLWLAFKLARAGTTGENAAAKQAGFADGAMLLVLNPKAYVIIFLMFTQFADAGPRDLHMRVLVITLLFTLNNLVAFSLWALAGDALGRLFRSETAAWWLNLAFATVLTGVGLWMLLG